MMFGLLTAKCVIFIENLEANKYIIQSLVEGYIFEVLPAIFCNFITKLCQTARWNNVFAPILDADDPWDTT